ncbi:ankyrin repeat, SAM and basic leucine zipper domain-containing protein 1 isoform X1 [Protopterus annectens]|uniref:ankyrin repeat, SAM and basic leucine zipper domain-containing protein 1 isoform X1 n=3 Tax=Protopterus annectens TaxID=7888 RepID=UPI001CF9D060|nr:ankyrin repeat, SAM and basic leucine zipper domain-containing protein 1 isoform X1 [Protopterus annectens]
MLASGDIFGNVIPAGEEITDSEDDDGWEIGCTFESLPSKKPVSLGNEEALKKALNAGDIGLVEELLNSGLDVDSSFQFGWTPLMYAANVANFELMRVLLDRGANASFSKDKYSVLMAACNARSVEEKIVKCVELLLSRNVNPNVSNSVLMTPLMLAAKEGYTQVITLLVAHGAEVNAQDINGYTALTWAVYCEQKSAILKLIEFGADKTLETKDGKTPAEIARRKQNSEVFALLAVTSSSSVKPENVCKEEAIFRYLSSTPDIVKDYSASCFRAFGDLDLFLHGLGLEHLAEMLKDSEISLRYLLMMGKEDLEKVGITDLNDQKKIMDAARELQVEDVKFGELPEFMNIETRDGLLAFLIKLNKQCGHLILAVQNIANQLPEDGSKVVLECDLTQDFTSVFDEVSHNIEELGKETVRLRRLLYKMQAEQKNAPGRITYPRSDTGYNFKGIKKIAAGFLGIGLVFLFNRLHGSKISP